MDDEPEELVRYRITDRKDGERSATSSTSSTRTASSSRGGHSGSLDPHHADRRSRRIRLPRHRARGDGSAQAVAAAVRREPRQGRPGRRGRHRLAPAGRHRPGRRPGCKDIDGDDENNGPVLREYAGHGTHIAGDHPLPRAGDEHVRRGLRRQRDRRRRHPRVARWSASFARRCAHKPQVINMSAGLRTRLDLPSLAFQRFHDRHLKDADCVLVAAAGNDTSPAPFWPAAFDWAVGVGALDRDLRVSDFSNYGSLRRRLRAGPQHRQRLPRRQVRLLRDAAQGRRPRVQDRPGAVERHVVRGADRGRPDRRRDLASGSDARTAADAVLARAVGTRTRPSARSRCSRPTTAEPDYC